MTNGQENLAEIVRASLNMRLLNHIRRWGRDLRQRILGEGLKPLQQLYCPGCGAIKLEPGICDFGPIQHQISPGIDDGAAVYFAFYEDLVIEDDGSSGERLIFKGEHSASSFSTGSVVIQQSITKK